MLVLPPLVKADAITTDLIWRLSVAQYHQMIAEGILTEEDPVEMLEGLLVKKITKNRPHTLGTQLTREALAQLMPLGWYVDAQEPLTTQHSEPEPDVLVVRGNRRDYIKQHPGPSDVALVVEVADATLQSDRTLKMHIYASALIPCYWILNLQDRQLESFSDPIVSEGNTTYHHLRIYHEGDDVPVIIDGQEIAHLRVGQLLP